MKQDGTTYRIESFWPATKTHTSHSIVVDILKPDINGTMQATLLAMSSQVNWLIRHDGMLSSKYVTSRSRTSVSAIFIMRHIYHPYWASNVPFHFADTMHYLLNETLLNVGTVPYIWKPQSNITISSCILILAIDIVAFWKIIYTLPVHASYPHYFLCEICSENIFISVCIVGTVSNHIYINQIRHKFANIVGS